VNKAKKYIAVFLLVCFCTSCSFWPLSESAESRVQQLEIAQIGFNRTGYSLLSETLQRNYDNLNNGIYQMQHEISVRGMSEKQMKMVMEYYRADNPQVFWFSGEYEYNHNVLTQNINSIHINYSYTDLNTGKQVPYTKETIQEMSDKIQTETRIILAGITPEMNDYQKVKYLHDYLATHVAYDSGGNFQHNLYGALVEKRAVCDGYAFAFQYLLSLIGIDSRIVYGSADGVGHAWNIVRMDGEYYHVDVTWDSTADETEPVTYSYFGVTDAFILQNRQVYSPWEGTAEAENSVYLPIPACTAIQNNYFVREDQLITDYQQGGREKISQIARQALEQGDSSVQVQFSKDQDMNLFLEEISTHRQAGLEQFPYSTETTQVSILSLDSDNLIIIRFKNLS
jgi:transglutaminase-like putative cysteine protease